MPLDTQGTLSAQIWTLWEGYAPFANAVMEGNRYKTSRPREKERQGNQNMPVNFPAVYCGGPDKTTNRGVMMPFNDDPSLMDMPIPIVLNAEWEVVYDRTPITAQTPAEAAMEAGLMRLGRKLGLQWVTSYTNQSLGRRDENIGGTIRTVSRGRITVNAAPLRSQLIALV